MADLRDQLGNQAHRNDEIGNQTHQTGLTGNKAPHDAGAGLSGTGIGHEGQQEQQLRRSGSSSSSSSEDDGTGGRRKKGLKEKVKEKMPGEHKEDPARAEYGTTTTDQHGLPEEKKGMMEKMKEKLPGQH